MSTKLVALVLTLCAAPSTFVAASPAAAQRPGQFGPSVRIWADGNRDYYRRGERLRVAFSTSADAFVAVVHVDPDGNLDFLYPASPWDEQFVRAGRTYSLPYGNGWDNGLMVRGRGGIGYLYIVASPEPLDYRAFRGVGRGAGWDWSYAGRSVRGDPFWAMEQITRMLIPEWSYAPFVVDYFSYQVDGPQRYPAYACSSWGGTDAYGWGFNPSWRSYYGSCDRLELFLRSNPYYFDASRYPGDRRSYYRSYRESDPRHLFKEAPDRAEAQVRRPSGTPYRLEDEEEVREAPPAQRGGTPRATEPSRRPVPETQSEPARGRVVQPRANPPVDRAPSATPRSRRPEGGD